MNFIHIKLKPTKRINTDFNPAEVSKDVEIPEASKKFIKDYSKSNKLSDDYDKEVMILFEDKMIYGFDYLYQKDKLLIPEINPTTIFYANAIMSHKKLISFRQQLFENSPTVRNYKKNSINQNLFGNFFQLATICITNLQSALESFANRQIPDDYEFIDTNGEEFEPSVFHKLDSALPKIHNKRFKSKYKKYNYSIRKLIELRNEIVHLKPAEKDANTQYKIVYRRLLKFDFTRAVISVKTLINFYEPNLIEECECGKELYYDVCE
ncbi:hypothetical protein [Mariniflexile sp. AS56]|uniref:hypothetical protein n=1 Tax=Flavobacteriaceae TaxID=49546 RepID=UPI0026F311DC|nr:hypothetical protein [Mariniflexile sp. AS56]MDO7174186.1 hypothetical protein [Mariniflexile sp. AS56]